MNRLASKLSCVACAAASIVALSDPAAASVRPYSAKGTAQFISATEFVGQGRATHLGLYSEAGSIAFSPTADPAVLQVDGTTVYTAANGDELHAVITGELNAVTGVVSATISYVGGTGRFSAASSTSILSGQLLPGGAVTVTVSGSIDY